MSECKNSLRHALNLCGGGGGADRRDADRARRCVLPMIALTGHFRTTDDLNGRPRITVAIERYPATHHAE